MLEADQSAVSNSLKQEKDKHIEKVSVFDHFLENILFSIASSYVSRAIFTPLAVESQQNLPLADAFADVVDEYFKSCGSFHRAPSMLTFLRVKNSV